MPDLRVLISSFKGRMQQTTCVPNRRHTRAICSFERKILDSAPETRKIDKVGAPEECVLILFSLEVSGAFPFEFLFVCLSVDVLATELFSFYTDYAENVLFFGLLSKNGSKSKILLPLTTTKVVFLKSNILETEEDGQRFLYCFFLILTDCFRIIVVIRAVLADRI